MWKVLTAIFSSIEIIFDKLRDALRYWFDKWRYAVRLFYLNTWMLLGFLLEGLSSGNALLIIWRDICIILDILHIVILRSLVKSWLHDNRCLTFDHIRLRKHIWANVRISESLQIIYRYLLGIARCSKQFLHLLWN